MARRLLGVGHAAEYLGISQTTLRKLNIPRKTYGGRKLYDRIDLDTWADQLEYENNRAEAEEEMDRLFNV